MGKTQDVLTMINRFKIEGLIPDVPVYIGGLSTKMTVIFDEFADSTPRNQPGFRILKDMEVKTGGRRKKRVPIVYQPGCIYALSSGMMTEKTVSNNFARGFISNPKNHLLFVGYADPASPAGHIALENEATSSTSIPNNLLCSSTARWKFSIFQATPHENHCSNTSSE